MFGKNNLGKSLLLVLFMFMTFYTYTLAQKPNQGDGANNPANTSSAANKERNEIINSLRLHLANNLKVEEQVKFRVVFLQIGKDNANICISLSRPDGSYFDIEKEFNLNLSVYDNKLSACMGALLKKENETWQVASSFFIASLQDRIDHNRPYQILKLGTLERKEILDALGGFTKNNLKIRKQFQFNTFYARIKDIWAFVSVGFVDPRNNDNFEWEKNGIDLSKYRLSKDFNTMEAFLRKEGNFWQVVSFSFNSDPQKLAEECKSQNCPLEIIQFYVRPEPNF
jgi:hypothetical protein